MIRLGQVYVADIKSVIYIKNYYLIKPRPLAVRPENLPAIRRAFFLVRLVFLVG